METTISENDFKELIPSCCKIGFAVFDDYNNKEQKLLSEFLPGTKTIIVLTHHIQSSLEWVWYPFENERCNTTCGADLHCQTVINKVDNVLLTNRYKTKIIPYPGQCGIMFKTLALKTKLGELGEHFLFMSNEWGPWIHLRILLTNAIITFNPNEYLQACTHCGNCLRVCPGDAIKPASFDGIKCRDSMRKRAKDMGNTPFDFECEICLRACPVGKTPKEVFLTYKDELQ